MSYSDDQKAVALAALAANRGNIKKTSKFVSIPASTLRAWRDGEGVHPGVTENRDIKKADLADIFESLARDIVCSITRDDMTDATLTDRMKSAGIAIDKMQLLRNRPTAITDDLRHMPDDELDRRIAEAEARKAAKA